jgi:hypothetical protein
MTRGSVIKVVLARVVQVVQMVRLLRDVRLCLESGDAMSSRSSAGRRQWRLLESDTNVIRWPDNVAASVVTWRNRIALAGLDEQELVAMGLVARGAVDCKGLGGAQKGDYVQQTEKGKTLGCRQKKFECFSECFSSCFYFSSIHSNRYWSSYQDYS